ncbi:MAG: polysaccharide biosynthesis/export family protein, partial [Pseudomonadota bacterium]|nr:polysaccharide biosynthesis/export family protein [Pseudomonadota bacterium]
MMRAALMMSVLSLLPIGAASAQQDLTAPFSQTTPQATPSPTMPPLQQQQQPASDAPPIPGATMLETPEEIGGVFGAGLFKGKFAQQSFSGFNPGYAIAVGDRIDLKLWGAVELNIILTVDSQGNVFVPRVGPVAVANIRNSELNELVGSKVRSIYRENVGVYAALANAEPVKVFVTGYVKSPGLYGAYASDSLLHFLDLAGGVSPTKGSFLDIRVLRAGNAVGRFNLYDFLLNGTLPLFQFQDGDTIVVWPQKSVARVDGLVRNAAQFEFDGTIALPDLLAMAGADPRATHVLLVRNQAPAREVKYLSVRNDALADIKVMSGDAVSVFADRQVGSIVARIEGEYEGLSQVALPYN